jgi:shikimate dehydrogenase
MQSAQKPTRFAVIGSPIAHSKSPQIHEQFAQQTKRTLTYEAIEVLPADLATFIQAFFESGGAGLNVTLPHKEAVFALAEVCSSRAQLARAANTLSLDSEGRLRADNTDGAGLLGDLERNHGITLEGKRLLMLGAGGATRGVLAAVADLPETERPSSVTVANRTVAKAQALAEDFKGALGIIINGTSASLGGELPPLSPALIAPNCCCYDMMYGSETTAFQGWAREHGAPLAIDGLGMLVGQAAESFFQWHGVRPSTAARIDQLRSKQ